MVKRVKKSQAMSASDRMEVCRKSDIEAIEATKALRKIKVAVSWGSMANSMAKLPKAPQLEPSRSLLPEVNYY